MTPPRPLLPTTLEKPSEQLVRERDELLLANAAVAAAQFIRSEWRLHREWFERSALADLLGEDAGLAEIHKLYRCHDRLLAHKQGERPAVKKAMAMGPEFREDPASISAEEQARRRKLVADQRAQPIPTEWIRSAQR
jgi:hypothetical protein